MRELKQHETEMVSGAGSQISLSRINAAGNGNAASPTSESTGWPALDNLLNAVENAFNKITSILDYYNNMWKSPNR